MSKYSTACKTVMALFYLRQLFFIYFKPFEYIKAQLDQYAFKLLMPMGDSWLA